MPMWRYQKCDTRDDVKTGMPDGWKVDVYKVTSGDSGKQYYVQVVMQHLERSGGKFTEPTYLCGCPEGTFKAPLSVVGLGPQCKHAENLYVFLEEKRKK